MEGFSLAAFYGFIIVYIVFVVTRLTTNRPEDDESSGGVELALVLHAGVVVLGVIIPLIVYACQGGFAGMHIGQILIALPDMAFDEAYGVPSRIVTYTFVIAEMYGLYRFVTWVHYRKTGRKD
jgi:hypothetical protein